MLLISSSKFYLKCFKFCIFWSSSSYSSVNVMKSLKHSSNRLSIYRKVCFLLVVFSLLIFFAFIKDYLFKEILFRAWIMLDLVSLILFKIRSFLYSLYSWHLAKSAYILFDMRFSGKTKRLSTLKNW